MGIIKWAHSSWEQRVPIHTAFGLLWVFGIAAAVAGGARH
jgi:hypothetical protein